MRIRGKRGVAFYILVAASSAGCAALAHVFVRMQVVQLGYEIAREQRIEQELAQEAQRLRIEVDALHNPARVEALAKRDLKMTPADPNLIRSYQLSAFSSQHGTELAAAPTARNRIRH
jgi:cell division protein FtsL